MGHVTLDICPGGARPGGTVLYAATMARRLGERVAVVTSAGKDCDPRHLLPGVTVVVRAAPATTVFENAPLGERRAQWLRARAADLRADDIPLAWRECPIVHLGPLAGEIGPELLDLFPRAVIGISAQGWLRRWDATGRVLPRPSPELDAALDRADVTFLSEEDLDLALVTRYSASARLLVLTRGAAGATVFHRGQGRAVAGFKPRAVVDTTGAGDVFAAAFLVALARGGDHVEAARFANCAASFAVEQAGRSGYPERGADSSASKGCPAGVRRLEIPPSHSGLALWRAF